MDQETLDLISELTNRLDKQGISLVMATHKRGGTVTSLTCGDYEDSMTAVVYACAAVCFKHGLPAANMKKWIRDKLTGVMTRTKTNNLSVTIK